MPDLLTLEEYSIIQDLVSLKPEDRFSPDFPENGTIVVRNVGGNKKYYYYQGYRIGASRQRPKRNSIYVGPVNDPDTINKVLAFKRIKSSREEATTSIRELAGRGFGRPSRAIGTIVESLAKAAFFMNGGILLGRSAIQTFPIVLGRKLNQRKTFPPADPEQEPTVFVASPKGSDLARILSQLDPSFEATHSVLDGINVTSFANENGWKVVSIESDDDEAETLNGEPRKPREVKPQKISPLLSFLMQRHASSMLLHGPGIPVRVPDAAHYAVFALVSASFWPCEHRAIAGIQGTLGQADEIMEALIASRDEANLAKVLQTACSLSIAWHQAILMGASRLSRGNRAFIDRLR